MSYESVRDQILAKVRASIKENQHRLNWTREEIDAFQQEQLKKLMRYVQHHSAFYKARSKRFKKLTDITPSTKEEIMEHWNDVICIPTLTKSVAEDYLAELRDKKNANPFYKDYYFITEGADKSIFIWDLDFFAVVGYSTFRYQYQDEQKKPIEGPKRIAAITSSNVINPSMSLFTLTVDDHEKAHHLAADADINELCEKLNQLQPTHLIGCSNIITSLAKSALDGKLTIKPQRISANSAPLTAQARKNIRKAFGEEPHYLWGNIEMGMAGIENDAHCGLFLSEDLLIIESVDEDLKPVKDPEEAKKLLVTNLFNLTFPIIRYVMDITVDIEPSNVSGFRLVKAIETKSVAKGNAE